MQSVEQSIMEAGNRNIVFLQFPSKWGPGNINIFLTNSRNPFHNICPVENANSLYIFWEENILYQNVFSHKIIQAAEVAFFSKSGESYQSSPEE